MCSRAGRSVGSRHKRDRGNHLLLRRNGNPAQGGGSSRVEAESRSPVGRTAVDTAGLQCIGRQLSSAFSRFASRAPASATRFLAKSFGISLVRRVQAHAPLQAGELAGVGGPSGCLSQRSWNVVGCARYLPHVAMALIHEALTDSAIQKVEEGIEETLGVEEDDGA